MNKIENLKRCLFLACFVISSLCASAVEPNIMKNVDKKEMEKLNSIRGEIKKIEWGSQIRSYVFQPYTMVKDHRTNFEMGNIGAVMDGDIDGFINAYLKLQANK